MGFFAKNDKSVTMSTPSVKMVHGIEIKKVPVGRYVLLMKHMEDFPMMILQQCFPDGQSAFTSMKDMSPNDLVRLLGKLLTVLPDETITALCEILDVDKEIILNNLTPNELLEVARAFWKMNDMNDFFGFVWGLIKNKLLTPNTGSSAGSLSPKQ